jgi:hypothetical protein
MRGFSFASQTRGKNFGLAAVSSNPTSKKLLGLPKNVRGVM